MDFFEILVIKNWVNPSIFDKSKQQLNYVLERNLFPTRKPRFDSPVDFCKKRKAIALKKLDFFPKSFTSKIRLICLYLKRLNKKLIRFLKKLFLAIKLPLFSRVYFY